MGYKLIRDCNFVAENEHAENACSLHNSSVDRLDGTAEGNFVASNRLNSWPSHSVMVRIMVMVGLE